MSNFYDSPGFQEQILSVWLDLDWGANQQSVLWSSVEFKTAWNIAVCATSMSRMCKWQREVDLCGGQDDTSVCWRWNLSCWWRLSGYHTNDGRKKCPIAGDWQLPFHQSYLRAAADSSHFFLSFFLESWLLTTAWSCPSFIRFSFVFVFFVFWIIFVVRDVVTVYLRWVYCSILPRLCSSMNISSVEDCSPLILYAPDGAWRDAELNDTLATVCPWCSPCYLVSSTYL